MSNPADIAFERIERAQRQRLEERERQARVERASGSPEARAIRALVQRDGNVDWQGFVAHCGGILAVVAMVDGNGQPDPEQIIPRVDELFAKSYAVTVKGGVTTFNLPRNRPYQPQGGAQGPVFPIDREPVDQSSTGRHYPVAHRR